MCTFSQPAIFRVSALSAGRMVALLMLPVLGGSASAQASPPVRGRDPWVFRLCTENRPRMLVAALRSDLWVSYNPANGTLQKVWNGGMEFHGKVYDFGQKNSKALGTTYYVLQKGQPWAFTTETSIPAGWTATGVTPGASAWTLTGSASVMSSPALDLTHLDHPVLAYQSPGGNNRLLVDVSADNGATWTAQQWMSIDTPGEDGNMKLLAVSGDAVKVRFRRDTVGNTATLADINVLGDYRAWSISLAGQNVSLRVDWRGYRLTGQTAGVTVLYDLVLPDGRRIAVEESPEAMTGRQLSRRFQVRGVPENAVISLEISGGGYHAAFTVASGEAALRTDGSDTFLDFTRDAQATLQTLWTP